MKPKITIHFESNEDAANAFVRLEKVINERLTTGATPSTFALANMMTALSKGKMKFNCKVKKIGAK
jgi:hypothetical protein